METVSASDPNSNMAFLRNELSKIFKHHFTLTWIINYSRNGFLAVKCSQIHSDSVGVKMLQIISWFKS